MRSMTGTRTSIGHPPGRTALLRCLSSVLLRSLGPDRSLQRRRTPGAWRGFWSGWFLLRAWSDNSWLCSVSLRRFGRGSGRTSGSPRQCLVGCPGYSALNTHWFNIQGGREGGRCKGRQERGGGVELVIVCINNKFLLKQCVLILLKQ